MKIVTPPNWNDEIQLNYPLEKTSIVFDAGMFEGGWAARILEKFNCKLIGLEPVKLFFNNCCNRFSGDSRVQIYNVGLASEICQSEMHVKGDASSRFIDDGKVETSEFMPLASAMRVADIDTIDLLKINIEGSEYSVLENIFASNLQPKIRFFQIQYHEGPEYSPERLEKIRETLSLTHECIWRWEPMTWESWQIK